MDVCELLVVNSGYSFSRLSSLCYNGYLKLNFQRWQIGLSSTAIASSFGKAISENKELKDYRPEDISRSLLRLISNNIGQVSCCGTGLCEHYTTYIDQKLFSWCQTEYWDLYATVNYQQSHHFVKWSVGSSSPEGTQYLYYIGLYPRGREPSS